MQVPGIVWEDVLQARLKKESRLASYHVDLATAPDGGLAIWVNGVCYKDIDELPDGRLAQAIRQAAAQWEQDHEQ